MTEQHVPFDRDAEEAVIGSLLIDPDALPRVLSSGLRPVNFHLQHLGTIYRRMLGLHAHGQAIDLVTVSDALRQHGELRQIGDSAELSKLITSCPTSIHAQHYAGIIKRCALQWRVVQAAGEMAKLGHGHQGTSGELAQAVRGLWQDLDLSDDGQVVEARLADYLSFDDVSAALGSVHWEWRDWLPAGFVTMIVGSQETGKSIMLLRLVGCYTEGWPWPDGTPFSGKRGFAVWAEGESGQRLNTQRAEAWGMDLSRILTPHDEITDFSIENEEHWDHFCRLAHTPEVMILVVDSLSGIHLRKENEAAMQRVIKPFAELARDINKPLGLSHHLNKPLRGERDVMTLHRVRGSGTITQTCRVVWSIDRPDLELPETRRLQVLKSNLGAKPEPVGFTISDKGVARTDPPEADRPQTRQDEAVSLLRGLLDKGAVQSSILKASVEKFGGSWDAAHRAKERLGIRPFRKDGAWWWGLPTTHEQEELTF